MSSCSTKVAAPEHGTIKWLNIKFSTWLIMYKSVGWWYWKPYKSIDECKGFYLLLYSISHRNIQAHSHIPIKLKTQIKWTFFTNV